MVRTKIHRLSNGCSVKLNAGLHFEDIFEQKWVLGSLLAGGGFGDVYVVSRDFRKNNNCSPHVVKVEPMSNGPLFVEMNFYLRVGKLAFIQKWRKERGLKFLGMPHLISFGSLVSHSTRYRFLILNRYGPDLWSLFLKNDRRFSLKSTLIIALQIIDVLEFIHFYGYVHADIKGANLVLGFGSSGVNQVYLIDFGVARMFVDGTGRHKAYTQDLRLAHNGTLEYTSRDAHVGAHSRRGDMEVLGYNLVQWLCRHLPWESEIDSDSVEASKKMYMSNIKLFMGNCFPRGGPPAIIKEFVQYVIKMEFAAKPDYDKLRCMFRKGLKFAGEEDDGKLSLSELSNRADVGRKRLGCNTENWVRGPAPQAAARKTVQNRKMRPLDEGTCRQTRLRTGADNQSKDFDWVKILQSDPDREAKVKKNNLRYQINAIQRPVEDLDVSLIKTPEDPWANPTPAMVNQMKSKRIGKRHRVRLYSFSAPMRNGIVLTPAMEEVISKRSTSNIDQGHDSIATFERDVEEVNEAEPIEIISNRLRILTRINYRELTPKEWEKFDNSKEVRKSVTFPSRRRSTKFANMRARPPTPPRSLKKRMAQTCTSSEPEPKKICKEISGTYLPRLRSQSKAMNTRT